MEIITFSDLSNDIINNIHLIPRDIDVIVGVPRSGLLVASMVGLYMNKPITDLDSFCNKAIYSSGQSKNKKDWAKSFNDIKKILLVEDSVNYGTSIKKALNRVAFFDGEVITLAAYIVPENKRLVNLFFREVKTPRLFEWNYLHHSILEKACFDIDGVLCVDPTDRENDNGDLYRSFLISASPKLIPTRKIGYLVTSRLECYREETEKWLGNQGIEYGQLIMYKGTFEERRAKNDHAEFKARVYKGLKNSVLFVESEEHQAERIRMLTGKQVLCVSGLINHEVSDLYYTKKRIKSKIIEHIPERILCYFTRKDNHNSGGNYKQ